MQCNSVVDDLSFHFMQSYHPTSITITRPICGRNSCDQNANEGRSSLFQIRCSLAENPADLPYCITKSSIFIVLNKIQYNKEVCVSVLNLLCRSWTKEVPLFWEQSQQCNLCSLTAY